LEATQHHQLTKQNEWSANIRVLWAVKTKKKLKIKVGYEIYLPKKHFGHWESPGSPDGQ